MKLISRHRRGWLSRRCCHLHAVIRPGSRWCRHCRGGVQQKPWSRLNKLSPIPLWRCSSAACVDSRNYEPPKREGHLWLVGRWDASSSIWGVKDTSRLPRVKAPSCFESATTSRHPRDGKLFGFFFFFWPQRPIRWSTVNAKTYTMSKSGDHAEMIYSCYTRFLRISLEGRGAHARSGLLLCLPAARVQVCDEWGTARDLCLCSVSLRTSQVVKVTHTFINASGKSESKKVRPLLQVQRKKRTELDCRSETLPEQTRLCSSPCVICWNSVGVTCRILAAETQCHPF